MLMCPEKEILQSLETMTLLNNVAESSALLRRSVVFKEQSQLPPAQQRKKECKKQVLVDLKSSRVYVLVKDVNDIQWALQIIKFSILMQYIVPASDCNDQPSNYIRKSQQFSFLADM